MNTFHLGYKNQSFYDISCTSRCLFSDKYKIHKYSVGRTYSCWMLNCWCITWPVGFKRLEPEVRSPNQDTPCMLMTHKFHCCYLKGTVPCPYTEGEKNPFYTVPSYFFKPHFNIILPPRIKPQKLSLSFQFPIKTLYPFLLSSIQATRPLYKFISFYLAIQRLKLTWYLKIHFVRRSKHTVYITIKEHPSDAVIIISHH